MTRPNGRFARWPKVQLSDGEPQAEPRSKGAKREGGYAPPCVSRLPLAPTTWSRGGERRAQAFALHPLDPFAAVWERADDNFACGAFAKPVALADRPPAFDPTPSVRFYTPQTQLCTGGPFSDRSSPRSPDAKTARKSPEATRARGRGRRPRGSGGERRPDE